MMRFLPYHGPASSLLLCVLSAVVCWDGYSGSWTASPAPAGPTAFSEPRSPAGPRLLLVHQLVTCSPPLPASAFSRLRGRRGSPLPPCCIATLLVRGQGPSHAACQPSVSWRSEKRCGTFWAGRNAFVDQRRKLEQYVH